MSVHEVSLVITSIEPKTDLNPAGGTIVTVIGENFPTSLDARYDFALTLNGNTRCVPISITSTEIKCELEPAVTARRRL